MPPATRTKTATQQALRFHGDTEETGTNGTFPKALGGPLSGLGTINALVSWNSHSTRRRGRSFVGVPPD